MVTVNPHENPPWIPLESQVHRSGEAQSRDRARQTNPLSFGEINQLNPLWTQYYPSIIPL